MSPPGSDQGVTPKEIKIAVMLVDYGGLNSGFGIQTPQQQQTGYEVVINSINASGGIACRQVVAQYFTANAGSQADLQAKCLEIVAAKVFYVIDNGALGVYPQLQTCYPRNQLPFYEPYLDPKSVLEEYYPYLFAMGSYETLYRNTVFVLKQLGFFNAENGFEKLGYAFIDCASQDAQVVAWLNQVGVPSSKIVKYNFGCPTTLAGPDQLAQAVLTFKQNGVTHVMETGLAGNFNQFTIIAEQQDFRPKYGIPDDGIQATSYGTQHPDWANINGAIAVTNYRYGEERTPNYSPTAGTRECNKIGAAQGQKPAYEQESGGLPIACAALGQFATMVAHAPALRRSALADGLAAAKSIDFGFPFGPATFAAGVTYGGNFWRSVQAVEACQCWRLTGEQTFQAGF